MEKIMTKDTVEKGQVSLNAKGFGFVRSLYEEDFYVRLGLARELLNEDWVSFTTQPGKREGSEEVARIVSLERESRFMLGTLVKEGERYRLDPDETCFVQVYVELTEAVSEGEVVAVRIPASKVPSRVIEARFVKNLGVRSRKGFDEDYALYKFNLASANQPEAAEEAGEADEDILAYRSRGWVDMRDIPFVTIDGESTTDIDDAVHVERRSGELYKVNVAIADVSAYVKTGGALEAQARERLTSVYFPGRTVHMLPESLSAGLASLKRGVPRLAIVCSLYVEGSGAIHVSRFTRAVIVSRERLTYSQVAKRMRDGETLSADSAIEKSLDLMQALYLELAKSRRERGVLEFNDQEPKLVTRADGSQEILWERRNDAHKLIEELMLLANKAAAEEFVRRKIPAMYRHQSEPLTENWEELRSALAEKNIPLTGKPSLMSLANIIEQASAGRERQHVEAIVRQVFQRAVYHNESPEHFSLGFNAYTHFTSPIRRYSDILVHRLLLGEEVPAETLKESAERCSDRSHEAKRAERFLWDRIKKRILFRDTTKTGSLTGMVLFSARKGVKVVLNQWNSIVFVPQEQLLAGGYLWDEATQHWGKTERLKCGVQAQVRLTALVEEKGNCELFGEIIDFY
jgi:ribonuclease R